ncbi:tetratricopeptide repeat protein [Henriciella litoralis]|uniref:tetratricopeptide repeat protein n=1 Tax=Henriciella litoralis TaxID=568102 RepID=UPI00111BDFCE|nr:tetratricopeptide repeat protein [Henriciella litoralis]
MTRQPASSAARTGRQESAPNAMRSLRQVSTLAMAASLLAGCVSLDPNGRSFEQRVEAARQEARINAAAEDYSQFLIARYASLINDPDEAARKYALVARSRPEDQSLAERAVFSALLANDFPLALTISSRTSAAIIDETSLPRVSLAADAMARGNFGDVPEIVDGADSGLFNGLILSSLKAWSLFAEGDHETAEITLMEGAGGDAYLNEIVLNLLGLMEVAGKADEAALETYARLDANGTLIATAADSYARLLAQQGETGKALDVLDTYLTDTGHNPLIRTLAEEIRAGETPEIIRLNARQGAALSVYVPAAALAAKSNSDLPGVYYSIALRLDPDLQAARALWADSLDASGRTDAAIAMLQSIPDTSPFYTTATGQLAWAFHRAGRDQDALDLAHRTLAGNPDRDLKIQMADLLRSLDKNDEALSVFSEVIAEDEASNEHDWRLYFARATLQERLGRWPQAEQDLLRARELNPASPDVLNYLGYSWVDRGVELEQGLDLIRKALTLRPESGAITDSLGWAHYKLGNYDKAIVYLERAAELEPGLAEVIDHLGDAYWMVGRRTEARFQWERAITLLDDDRDIADIQSKFLTGPTAATPKAP